MLNTFVTARRTLPVALLTLLLVCGADGEHVIFVVFVASTQLSGFDGGYIDFLGIPLCQISQQSITCRHFVLEWFWSVLLFPLLALLVARLALLLRSLPLRLLDFLLLRAEQLLTSPIIVLNLLLLRSKPVDFLSLRFDHLVRRVLLFDELGHVGVGGVVFALHLVQLRANFSLFSFDAIDFRVLRFDAIHARFSPRVVRGDQGLLLRVLAHEVSTLVQALDLVDQLLLLRQWHGFVRQLPIDSRDLLINRFIGEEFRLRPHGVRLLANPIASLVVRRELGANLVPLRDLFVSNRVQRLDLFQQRRVRGRARRASFTRRVHQRLNLHDASLFLVRNRHECRDLGVVRLAVWTWQSLYAFRLYDTIDGLQHALGRALFLITLRRRRRRRRLGRLRGRGVGRHRAKRAPICRDFWRSVENVPSRQKLDDRACEVVR